MIKHNGARAKRLRLDDMPDVMTVPEAARYMRIGLFAAYSAIRRREMPALHLGRRKVRVSKVALLAWMRTGEMPDDAA